MNKTSNKNTHTISGKDPLKIFRTVPVDKDHWGDLERLFESRGSPHFCWCMVWRKMMEGKNRKSKADKKASLKDLVDRQIPVGILGYSENEPVAWCSVAPRDSFRELHGDESFEQVWSIVCFFVKRSYRKQGIASLLIREAASYAKGSGARWLEAYPVEPDSPGYWFMGFVHMFERSGFVYVKDAGSRRKVMRLDLVGNKAGGN